MLISLLLSECFMSRLIKKIVSCFSRPACANYIAFFFDFLSSFKTIFPEKKLDNKYKILNRNFDAACVLKNNHDISTSCNTTR